MKRKTTILILIAMSVLALGSWLLVQAVYAAGTTVTVNGSGDLSDWNPGDGACDVLAMVSGDQCSLRAAIEELNALGPDTTPHRIEFDISVTGPVTITPSSELPAITVPVEIDGETQPGANCPTNNAPATLQIVLDGSNAGTDADGLVLSSGSDSSIIQGLVIGNFDDNGILILSDDNKVGCNHIGLGLDGVTVIGNGFSGVYLVGNGNSIGGENSSQQRNVISGNFRGITIDGNDNLVRNNFIGTSSDGLIAVSNATGILGNVSGIYISGVGNSIGGISSVARNVISGNNGSGIRVNGGENNIFLGNYIGVARDGNTPLPNNYGIQLSGAAVANIVGGIAAGEANLVAYNTVNGIQMETNVVGVPSQNEIRGNAVFDNGGMGLDLGNDGVDSNDPGDGDGDENERQNYPVIMAADSVIELILESEANTFYLIDFYRNDSCDSSGNGEGKEYLNWMGVSTNGQGAASFTVATSFLGVSSGDVLTVTATDPNGNTSEFSVCALVNLEPTPTNTPVASETPTATPTPTNTATPSWTPSPTGTQTPTVTGTIPPAATPSATPTETPDPPQTESFFVYLPFVVR